MAVSEREAGGIVASLFEARYAALVRYAARFTQDLDAAEEVVQDAFVQLYRELRNGGTVQNPAGWMVIVVRHQARRSRTVLSRYQELELVEGLPAGRVEQPPLENGEDRIRGLAGALSKREEEVLFLRLSAMKYHEIARHLGISASSVNTLLARALGKLQKAAGEQAAGAKPATWTGHAAP